MITIIVAVSADGVIGKNNEIPWRIKSDIDHFKNVTSGHTVIMGRNTWDSIPTKFCPLPDRRNIVLSRRQGFIAEGAEVVPSLEEALALTENDAQVFIMGGAEVYRQAMPLAERLLVTHVHKIVGDGNAFFPIIDPQQWNLVSRREGGKNDTCDFTIADYSPNLRYIELANVRTHAQLKEYRLIRERGHCPFCTEHLFLYHNNPILQDGQYWVLTRNDYPYSDTDAHLILILKRHEECAGSLTTAEQQEFFSIVNGLETAGDFPGGGVCIRSGNPLRSGASIKHIHGHIILPTKGAEPVRFYMGNKR